MLHETLNVYHQVHTEETAPMDLPASAQSELLEALTSAWRVESTSAGKGLLSVWLTSFTPGCPGGKDVSHAEEVPRRVQA